ncbi:MAG TPA: GIDE domain-containing protein [Kofleriaceae bacterium]|nr:GIDE domain-containing protein [Kofleriaceae bacterium]
MWPLLLTVGVVGAGAVVFTLFTGNERIRRTLRNMPAKKIGELSDDERAKIVGRVRALGEALEAPISGRRCVAYSVSVVEQEQNASHIRETKAVAFVVEDGSGRALVDPTAARIAIDGGPSVQTGTLHDPTPAAEDLLLRHGKRPRHGVLYREAVITDGESIAVLGAGTREPDPDAPPTEAYRGDARTRLRLTSSRKYPLVISDDPSALK